MLQVDVREDEKVFRILDKEKIPYERKQLLIGDYADSEKQNFVVERKTIEDFLLSYCSKHLFEQMQNCEENLDAVYLFISGKFENLFFKRDSLPQQIRHLNEFSYTKMKLHTLLSYPKVRIVEFITDAQLIRGVAELFTYAGSKRLEGIIRMKVGKDEAHLAQICAVPGIGREVATAIRAVYSPKELYGVSEEELLKKKIRGLGAERIRALKEVFI